MLRFYQCLCRMYRIRLLHQADDTVIVMDGKILQATLIETLPDGFYAFLSIKIHKIDDRHDINITSTSDGYVYSVACFPRQSPVITRSKFRIEVYTLKSSFMI